MSRSLWPPLALVLVVAGCKQNVTCVFTNGCSGGTGAISGNQAIQPVDGEWIQDGAPRVEGVFPTGVLNPGTTPVVVVFSESVQPTSLQDGIEIVPLVGGGLAGDPLTGVPQTLLAEGRVLVLLPSGPIGLTAGDYLVRVGENAAILDLTGQGLDAAPGERLGNFTVATTPSAVPQLVTSFPRDTTTNQGETTQIVAVFDRPVQAQSVNAASFDVRVAGVDPPNDPLASSVTLNNGTLQDTRVFLWRSVDGEGRAVPLGTNAQVELRLSPAASPITESDGGVLAPRTVSFRTLTFAAAQGASLLSNPHDAIGLANLTPGNAEELMVEVELEAAEPNDSVDLFLFGVQKSRAPDPPFIALQRTIRLSGTAPIQSALFTREDVALQLSTAPDDVRFADGALTMAFRVRRGTVVTPLRVLDLDPAANVIQDPLLDTTIPAVASLIGASGTGTFRSDLRGLSLAGQADGALGSVEVTTPLGTNGSLAPVVGSTEEGLFLAAAVDLGLIPNATTTYSFVARDPALNAAPVLAGTATQVGVVGPGAWAPGLPIEVEAYDARTLEPLGGARVIVHADQGNGTAYPFVASEVTLADGRVTVASPGAPAVAAIVTVDLAGYDLVTLHGVPSVRLSVPLSRSNQALARSAGTVSTTDPAALVFLPGLDRRFDDSRRAVELPRGFVGVGCAAVQGVLACTYGPETIRTGRLGARSFFAGNFQQTELAFSATQLLQAFGLSLPIAPATTGQLQTADFELPFLLTDPATPAEEAALGLPVFTFRVESGSGVNLAALSDDVTTTGAPFVSVETLVTGLPGSIAVSQGISFDQGGGDWQIRTAIPGAITAAGSLGSRGAVSTDPFVRVEVVDEDGNAAGIRPRLSALIAAGSNPVLRALAVPSVLSPLPSASTGGEEFNLRLVHAIGDDRTEVGLYRVLLRDENGRAWTLWLVDPAGTGDIEIRVVDPADGGGTGLANGTLTVLASAYAWNTLVPAAFLWTDLEREFGLFSRAAQSSFLKP